MAQEVSGARATRAVEVLHTLHRDVSDLTFPLEIPGTDGHRDARDRVLAQVSSQLLPRVADADSPAVVVLGGPTGAGKSSLLNSLVGREVSAAGVLRPTTRRAVAAHHPTVHSVPLRSLADSVATPALPAGLVVVDAPDLDSLERANRSTATQLLEAADLWILVTTAARYGDMIPWSQVIRARDRGLQLAVVLNRVPKAAKKDVRADLTARLDSIGLGNSPLFVIPDLGPHEGPLPEEHVAPLRDWLRAATGRHRARGIVRRTAAGAWDSLAANVAGLVEGVSAQRAAAGRLRTETLEGLRGPQADVAYAIETGQVGAGAPTTRWETFAPAGMVLAPFSIPGSRAASTPRAIADRTAALTRLSADVEAAIVTLLADALHDAAATIHREWEEAGATHLLAGHRPLTAGEARGAAEGAVVEWKGEAERILDEHRGAVESLGTLTEAPGVTALLIAAVGGVGGASSALSHFISDDVAAAARATLLGMARHAIGSVAEPYLKVLRALPDSETEATLTAHATRLKELS
ncbi:MAG: 50S ribosome-binding GTPase [bacterium]|nr:50S ribosome-binding GTPase [bacterium]